MERCDKDNEPDVFQPPAPSPGPTAPPAPPNAPPTKTKPSGAPAPSKTTPTGDASTDHNACSQALRDARTACDPSQTAATTNPSTTQSNGMKQTCQQISQLNQQATNANLDVAHTCYVKYSNCSELCNNSADTHPDDASFYHSTASSCDSLSGNMSMIGNQAANNYNAQGAGQNCNNQIGSMSPQSAGSGSGDPNSANQAQAAAANDPYGCTQNPSSAVCQNCTVNPNSPNCKALNDGQQATQGKASFQTASKTQGPGDFNVGDLNSNARAGINPVNSQDNQFGGQPQNHGVPNGGGPMPGGDQAKPANLDGPQQARVAGPPGNPTDIERGMLAGGFSSSGGDAAPGSGGGYNYGNGPNGSRTPASAGMDLKKYLPGQALYHLAGSARANGEINPASVDMFKKISALYETKCKLGVLHDCR